MNPVDKWMDKLEEDFFEGSWDAEEKRPLFKVTEDPLFLMTYSEPEAGSPRSWSHLRRNALAAPIGYEDDGVHREEPLINWVSHFHTPESWETLKEDVFPDSDRYVVNLSNVARQNMKSEFKEYLEADDETVIMNPPDVMDTFLSKKSTFNHLSDNDLPTIPTATGRELVYEGREYIEDKIGSMDEGIVIKPDNGSGGEGVIGGSFEEVSPYLTTEDGRRRLLRELDYPNPGQVDQEELLENILIQPKIEHSRDLRMETVGDSVINGEIRLAPQGELCTNLSKVSSEIMGEDMAVYGKALNSMKGRRVIPLDIDISGDISDEAYEELSGHREDLPSTNVIGLTRDLVESYDPDQYGWEKSNGAVPIKHGADIMQADMGDIGHLPTEHLSAIEEYADDGDIANIVIEQNGNPGSMVDLIARWSGNPEQISTLHVYNQMRELAGLETQSPSQISENESSEVWGRLDGYYPSLDDKLRDYRETARTNL